MTPFYKDSLFYKFHATAYAFLAIYSAASQAYLGEKSLAYKMLLKQSLTTSAIFSKISLALDYQELKTYDIPNRSFRCFCCRKVENFYLKKVVSDIEYNDTCCVICLQGFKANESILSHSGDGEKHPIHVNCFNPMLSRKNDCEKKIKYDLLLITTILFGAIYYYRITPPIDPNRVTPMLPNYIPQ